MAITPAVTTPAVYSDSAITRYGLINGLNIVNVHAYNQYFDMFNTIPYGMLNQILGNEEKSDNKQFKWYQSQGRALGFVTAAADVTVANNAAATITLGAGSYSQAGTKSLPALGFIFYNSRTGVESRVSAVPNKATANAHTMQITPVVQGTNASVLSGDELLGRGFKYLGEQSDKTETIIRNTDLYTNYCTELRADSTIGDLAMAEKIEFQINGNYSYTYKQMKDDNLRLMQELDLLLFEGTQTNNLPYVEEGSNGAVKQVQANGINGTYATWNLAQFAALDRAFNAVGAPKEYDILSDNLAYVDMQNSIFTEINNGGIVYADAANKGDIAINRTFQSFRIYNRKYNFTNFGIFDEQTMYGSSGTGLRSNFSMFMPVGKTSTANERGGSLTKPRFTVMYQTPNGGNKWHTWETGAFADTPTSTKAERVMSTIGYFGVRLIGAQQYAILKGGS